MTMINNPFARAKSMFAAIAAIMASNSGYIEQNAAINALPEYESRGKGGNHNPIGKKGGHMAAVRKARKARNMQRNKLASRGKRH